MIKSKAFDYHLHCVVEYSGNIFINDLRVYLTCCYDAVHLDVQPCRSKKTALIYISKEDRQLLTNVKTSALHFNYRVHMWAKSVSVFRNTDPFVVQHRHKYNFCIIVYIYIITLPLLCVSVMSCCV